MRAAGFPKEFLTAVAERLPAEFTERRSRKHEELELVQKKVAVIPRVHGASHRLKKVGNRAGAKVVFSAKNKLSNSCGKENAESQNEERKMCTRNHATRFTECNKEVVYDIPLRCGRLYIGQAGRHAREATSQFIAHHAVACPVQMTVPF